jgi:hypothetical protein
MAGHAAMCGVRTGTAATSPVWITLTYLRPLNREMWGGIWLRGWKYEVTRALHWLIWPAGAVFVYGFVTFLRLCRLHSNTRNLRIGASILSAPRTPTFNRRVICALRFRVPNFAAATTLSGELVQVKLAAATDVSFSF